MRFHSRATIDVTVAGHRLHMTLYARKAPPPINAMTVVFESGFGGGENNWRSVIEQLPAGVSAITYERPGINGSEPDGLPPSPEHIATVLHTALAHVASPPYLLVGHSWGGPLVRALSGLFPKDVAGLVLVDPTDFGETAEDRRRYIYEPLGYGKESEELRGAVDAYYAQPGRPLRCSGGSGDLDVTRRTKSGFQRPQGSANAVKSPWSSSLRQKPISNDENPVPYGSEAQ